ncbi:glycosyltransferase [Sinorhizobium medicae]|nr:glycosyltransferase [Sinorhizobium medicae]MDX0766957.1 glycosyltransferase [Sinorhizobium medicae]
MDILTRTAAKLANGRIEEPRALNRIARVTVVVPCYNYGRYLRQCVESVTLNQPGVDVEVIIVDDRSTDDSAYVARSIQDADKRVHLIAHKQNKGHIATYNDGLEAATGEFVLLLSADDLVTPGALTRAAEFLAAEPSVGLVYGNAIHFHGELPESRIAGGSWIVWPGVDWLRIRCRSGFNTITSPEAVMRTAVLREIGNYRADLPHAGDFEMWLRTSAVSDIGFLAGVDQAYYRHHATNMNKQDFGSGTALGQLIDLKQRWQSFEAVFSGVGSGLEEGPQLLELARSTIARQVLERINYAHAKGWRDFPTTEFEALAREIHHSPASTTAGKVLAKRRHDGTGRLPAHALWPAWAVRWRLEEWCRRWRRGQIGV